MSSPFPADRIQFDEVSPKPLKAMYHLQNSLDLDETLANLPTTTSRKRSGTSLSERELAEVVYEATVINASNQLMITAPVQRGLYEPDMLRAA